jgi:hypothetical protein
MNKREKILVTLTIVVAIGAGLFLLLDNQSGEQPRESPQPQASLSEETMKLMNDQDLKPFRIEPGKYKLREYERHVIQAASQSWPGEIFYQHQTGSDRKTSDPGLHYSGYMQTNGQYLAIINGLPYAPGERLHGTGWGGYQVQSVNPEKVVLSTPQGRQKHLALQSQKNLVFHSPDSLAGKQDETP